MSRQRCQHKKIISAVRICTWSAASFSLQALKQCPTGLDELYLHVRDELRSVERAPLEKLLISWVWYGSDQNCGNCTGRHIDHFPFRRQSLLELSELMMGDFDTEALAEVSYPTVSRIFETRDDESYGTDWQPSRQQVSEVWGIATTNQLQRAFSHFNNKIRAELLDQEHRLRHALDHPNKTLESLQNARDVKNKCRCQPQVIDSGGLSGILRTCENCYMGYLRPHDALHLGFSDTTDDSTRVMVDKLYDLYSHVVNVQQQLCAASPSSDLSVCRYVREQNKRKAHEQWINFGFLVLFSLIIAVI